MLIQNQNDLGIFSKNVSSKVDGFNKDIKKNYTSSSMYLASHDFMKELYRPSTYFETNTV